MLLLLGSLAGILLYLEIVYHFCGFGWSGYQPFYSVMLILVYAGVEGFLVGLLKGKLKKTAYYLFLWTPIVWAGLQYVYLHIFKQPLLWEAVFRGAGDALTNYWKEALLGVAQSLPVLLLMVAPAVVLGILFRKRKWELPDFGWKQMLITGAVVLGGFLGQFTVMVVGKSMETDYYEAYTEFYAPLEVAEGMGFLPMLQRDTVLGTMELFAGMTDDSDVACMNESVVFEETEEQENAAEENTEQETVEDFGVTEGETQVSDGDAAEVPITEEVVEEPLWDQPQQFTIDYEVLRSLADNEKQEWLANYIEQSEPTKTNEYTGMFEGYNLIYLTAEGFSTYAIREDLTPTLYRLVNSGFVFENYYVPLWQTSTSDGEYINCTGLIPDGQFSMRKSGANDMAYTLPRFFEEEGVKSYAYHNNSLSYYDRHVTHPNLGYEFKACQLGNLSEEEWGASVFYMEHPKAWPASDLEMVQSTAPEYLAEERFHTYYMTVSGHMNYNFKGNSMSSKNRDAVAGLEMSENARAYLACNIELDKALENLLAQLEAAGKLENTVICLSADHYPYGMTEEEYEELAGKSLAEGKDKFRNSLILWNAGMTEPVYVDKACGSMDLIPTLLNLFGFSYDSRMYAGKDIFSTDEGMVIFNDRSFVTDGVICPKKVDPIWIKNEDGTDVIPDEMKETYLSEKKKEVKDRYQFSAYILQENYYQDVEAARVP